MIIDADSHITEPRDVWTSRMASKWAGQVPHVVRGDDGRDVWMLNGEIERTVGITATAGWPAYPASHPLTYEDCHPGSYQAADRLRYMDEEGIWAQVLYPNVGGFGGQTFLKMKDDELKLASVRAYNDFLHEEWYSCDPQRLVTLISTPFWDVDATVREIQRCADRGFRGILFTGEPQRFDLPYLGDRHWDPLWSVAQEAGLPIHFHIGGSETDYIHRVAHRASATSKAAASAYGTVDLFLKNGTQCGDLITSGVLPRFPDLKFVSVESGIGWVPFMLEAADYAYLGVSRAGRVRTEDLLPSELFARQVYCTFWFEQVAPRRLFEEIPIDNILFETDFPHPVCLYGNIRETIDAGLGHVSAEVRSKVLWENAASLYGIERPVPMATAVGQ